MIALLLLLQDDRIDALLEQLRDDRVEMRDAAQCELVEIGKPVLARLKALEGSDDDELRARAEAIRREVELWSKLEGRMRRPSRVTLDLRDAPLREALEDLARATGNPLDLDAVPADARVTWKGERVGYWEALDALCSGRAWGPSWDGEIVRVRAGPPSGRRKAAGAFLVSCDDFRVALRNTSGAVTLCWERGIRPCRVAWTFSSISDDRGRELRSQGRFQPLQVDVRGDACAITLPIRFRDGPGLEAKSMKIAGRARVLIPLRFSSVEFAPEAGDAHRVEDVDLSLEDLQRTGNTLLCRFVASEEIGALSRSVVVPDSLDASRVEIVDAGGARHSGTLVRGFFTGGRQNVPSVRWVLRFTVPEEVELKSIVWNFPAETHAVDVDFDLRDIPFTP